MRGKDVVDDTAGDRAGNRNGEVQLPRITWLSPEADLWVGSSSADFVGMITFQEGHFLAHDARNRSLGSFSDLRRAKETVELRWETKDVQERRSPASILTGRLRSARAR